MEIDGEGGAAVGGARRTGVDFDSDFKDPTNKHALAADNAGGGRGLWRKA